MRNAILYAGTIVAVVQIFYLAQLAAQHSEPTIDADAAIAEADVCLFLIDARAGVTPLDSRFAQILRRAQTPVILAANKCEGWGGEAGRMEAYELGMGTPLSLSAEHGQGLDELYDALLPYANRIEDDEAEQAIAEQADQQRADPQ